MGDFSPCVQAPPDPSHRNPWLGPGHQNIFRISGWLPWWRGLRGAILDILGQGLPQMLAPPVHRTKDRILRERKGTGFQRPQITAISASLKMFATLSKHFFFFLAKLSTWHAGFQFPDQGSDPGRGSDGDISQALGQQGTPELGVLVVPTLRMHHVGPESLTSLPKTRLWAELCSPPNSHVETLTQHDCI